MRADDYGFFHVCTDGNVLPWMFRDDNDFSFGINRIGVCKILTGVTILTFILMDNHVHFLLYGSFETCQKFIDKYKQLTGKWIAHKYGVIKHLKHLPISIIPLRSEEDILEVASYIDRNAIMAGFCGLPSEYPWGSCHYMFKNKAGGESCKWYKIQDFTRNELRDLIRTRVELPGEWSINNDGILNPKCFVDLKKAEELFRSPVRYMYFLTRKLEGKIDQSLTHGGKTFLADKELREITASIAHRMFGTTDIKALSVKSRLRLASILKNEYLSSVKQISRMLYLDASLLKGFV
jgi:hypothetical protein